MSKFTKAVFGATFGFSCLAFAFTLTPLFQGCATLAPGADPLVVRVEQTQRVAGSTFNVVLNEDNANRQFWSTNAPAFHNFCQWLRTPTPYTGPGSNGNTNIARCLVMQFNLDDLKIIYKNAKTKGSSNDLFTAEATILGALSQAQSWITIATNSIH